MRSRGSESREQGVEFRASPILRIRCLPNSVRADWSATDRILFPALVVFIGRFLLAG